MLVVERDTKALLHKLWFQMTPPVQDGSTHIPDSLDWFGLEWEEVVKTENPTSVLLQFSENNKTMLNPWQALASNIYKIILFLWKTVELTLLSLFLQDPIKNMQLEKSLQIYRFNQLREDICTF